MPSREAIKDGVIGAVIAIALLIPIVGALNARTPVPYYDVEVTEFTRSQNGINLSANFIKNGECIFKELAVFAGTLGEWRRIEWYDQSHKEGDRFAGRNSVDLIIAIPEWDRATELEVRTRHLCGEDGIKVDEIFLRKDL